MQGNLFYVNYLERHVYSTLTGTPTGHACRAVLWLHVLPA